MKPFKLMLLFLAGAFTFTNAVSQNALINILTQNSGILHKGETIFVEVTVNNTDPASFIGVYKIKTHISVPSAISTIASSGHILPTGWTILSNTGAEIVLSNGKDIIAANDARTILIAIQGNNPGGPSTIMGQLSFSNGTSPGAALGSLPGDNPADNSSISACKIIR
ncbi:MAG: hypothetical protein H7Y86_14680 [Rhizobacter sp.]|nr:hypothetical protein [Ferruginibacter sp.]